MDEKREDLGPLLVEQFRQQMNNLSAAIQLLTPVVREKAGPQYDPYLAILHQSLYRFVWWAILSIWNCLRESSPCGRARWIWPGCAGSWGSRCLP